jgi:hypothetical protein
MPREPSFDAVEATLKRAVAVLRDESIPFLLGGSLASWARGGPETRHDLDLIVRPADAERALTALCNAGMRAERPPEEWLLKAWDGEMLVDLIFEPKGIEVTDDLIGRGEELEVLGMRMRVMTLEDLMVTKLLVLDEHSLDYGALLRTARALREQIDWSDVRSRTADSPFARAFFTLVEGLGVVQGTSEGAYEGARVTVLPGLSALEAER